MIYDKTELGQFAAYDVGSTLPRKLRTLLIFINGKTESEEIVAKLRAYGDVQALIDALETAGLIEQSEPNIGKQRIAAKASAHEVPLSQQVALLSNKYGWAESNTASSSDVEDIKAALELTVMRKTREAMSDFILQHLPSQSFVMLAELDKVRTYPELERIYAKFEPVAMSVGTTGEAHWNTLRETLSLTDRGKRTAGRA